MVLHEAIKNPKQFEKDKLLQGFNGKSKNL